MRLANQQSRKLQSSELLALLRCVTCGSGLLLRGQGFSCPGCGQVFSERNGVVSFVEPQNYADSFGFQWKRYARTQLDHDEVRDSERHFRMTTGLTPDDLRGRLVLDVGCGMGRFAEVATRWGARVVGIDLSAAAEVAAQNLAHREFVALRADVFKLPFASESFDYIYSIGVLHHTPDCERAVKALPRYLKPGGTMAVWLYSGYNSWYRFSDLYRRFTTRVPPSLLHGFLRRAVPFFYHLDRGLREIPLVGRPLAGLIHHVFPVNRNQNADARILDTFDWYSPKYQSKHTYEQVFQWLRSCNLEDFQVADIPIAVRGRKPAAVSVQHGGKVTALTQVGA